MTTDAPRQRAATSKAIPGLRGWELYRALGPLKNRPHEMLRELAVRFGGIMDLPYPTERVILLTQPAYIEYVLEKNPGNYNKNTSRWRAFRQLIGDGVLAADGDTWRRQRQRVQPAFHASRLSVLETYVREETQTLHDRWRSSLERGTPIHALDETMELTLRVMCRTMFSHDVGAVIGPLMTALDAAQRFIDPFSLANFFDAPRFLRRALSPGFLAFERALRLLDEVVGRIISERRSSRQDTGDILSMLIEGRDDEAGTVMTSREVRDEIITILQAGHEPAAVTLAWAFYLLSAHPEIQQTAASEVRAVVGDRPVGLQDLSNLPYLKAVIDETLRLYPPAWGFDRRAIGDDLVDGYEIPAGSTVAISTYVMHRHPAYWTEPDRFDPSRFVGTETRPRAQYAYLPFGGGPRRCLGSRFATTYIALVLTTMLQRYELRLVPGQTITIWPRINLCPREPIWMTLQLRAPAASAAPAP